MTPERYGSMPGAVNNNSRYSRLISGGVIAPTDRSLVFIVFVLSSAARIPFPFFNRARIVARMFSRLFSLGDIVYSVAECPRRVVTLYT